MITIISDCGQFRATVTPSDNGASATFWQIIPHRSFWKPIGQAVAIPFPFHVALDMAFDIVKDLSIKFNSISFAKQN
jgi:hypothetical protein